MSQSRTWKCLCSAIASCFQCIYLFSMISGCIFYFLKWTSPPPLLCLSGLVHHRHSLIIHPFNLKTCFRKKQEAFRERRHLHVCDLRPWRVILTLTSKVKKAYVIRCRLLYCALVPGMSVKVIVCEVWTLINFVTFALHLWPSAYIKVIFTRISRCTLCSCTLVPSMKFVW